MKINKIFAMIALGALFCGCDQKLPYDLEGTEHGVVISISKVPGSDGILSTDINSGNYKVRLDVPVYQGDYSMLEDAQIMAVYTDGNKKNKSADSNTNKSAALKISVSNEGALNLVSAALKLVTELNTLLAILLRVVLR